MASSGPSKPKQRRLQGSCDLCRQKKVKCDSAKMPGFRCTNCIAFDSECTHFHVTKKTTYNFGSAPIFLHEHLFSDTILGKAARWVAYPIGSNRRFKRCFNGALGTTVTATDLSVLSLPQFSIDHPNYPHPATISNAMSVTFDALSFPQAHTPTSGIQDFDSMGFNQIDALAGVPIGFEYLAGVGTYIANYEAQTPLQQATPVPGADPSSNATFRFF
ncbi:hypothetical protein D9611_014885 [Ephemerocybe angulata]|uniref:Zn(2)-C6 fungal-type domain-containing protein n=1 Tax=Ephemerocybe angulata TaxID=980116 RepID=A0A8H5C3K1_9AGAR|nr:hypothetical protein D9611_014885 [Tulosesus angulatus]